MWVHFPLCLLVLAASSWAETCEEPTVVPNYYTTFDAVINTETVFIVEILLSCKNGAQNMALYADVGGKQLPVTKGQDVGRYQVSWSTEHKNARSGTYVVKFYDEEAFGALRKAQRSTGDIESVKALFTVNVDHRGAWNGPWVATEVLAAGVGILIFYFANHMKTLIQS
uniref:translocon-associated protein subunit delta-like n=1 Tax=Myxine glutinosa TaxID=7769 RepID=UPI00358EF22C